MMTMHACGGMTPESHAHIAAFGTAGCLIKHAVALILDSHAQVASFGAAGCSAAWGICV